MWRRRRARDGEAASGRAPTPRRRPDVWAGRRSSFRGPRRPDRRTTPAADRWFFPTDALRGLAGIARWWAETPSGSRASMRPRRRQLTAKARRSKPVRRDRAANAPVQNAPIPVGRPRSGVASSATRKAAWEGTAAPDARRGLMDAPSGRRHRSGHCLEPRALGDDRPPTAGDRTSGDDGSPAGTALLCSAVCWWLCAAASGRPACSRDWCAWSRKPRSRRS